MQGRGPPQPPSLSPLVVSLGFAVLVLGVALVVPYFRLPSFLSNFFDTRR